jgi:hypothetical protein
VEIEVQPLPEEGKPADFSGGVGEFTVRVTPDRSSARAEDDIVKLQVRVEGAGDASVITAPTLPALPGAELLEDPKSAVTRWTDKDKRLSAKTFDYLLRPLTPGTLEIPPLTVSFFNPTKKQYETAQSAPVRIEITPGSHPTPPVAVSASAPRRDDADTTDGTRATGDDFRYIHAGNMTVFQRGVLTGEGPVFVLLLGVPPLLLFAGWLTGRLRAARDSRYDHFRARDAALHARRQLRRAAGLIGPEKATLFYAELASALRRYFSGKFRADTNGLTVEEIEAELERRGAPPELAVRVRMLLDECDAARYAPTQPSRERMRETLSEAGQIIDAVEGLR